MLSIHVNAVGMAKKKKKWQPPRAKRSQCGPLGVSRPLTSVKLIEKQFGGPLKMGGESNAMRSCDFFIFLDTWQESQSSPRQIKREREREGGGEHVLVQLMRDQNKAQLKLT